MKALIRNKYLQLLVVAYVMAYFIPCWSDARHIKIFGLSTGGSSIAFPFTYILADVITEVYGYKNTRFAMWIGLSCYVIFLMYGNFVAYFISPLSPNHVTFNLLIRMDNWIIIAIFVNYICTETINSFLVAKMKIWLQGRFMGIRFIISTFITYGVDELIYAPIAFHSFLNIKNLIYHMFNSWVFMAIIEILVLPISIRLAQYMKKKEQIDIYDTSTNFTPFSLNTVYQAHNNRYKQNNQRKS